MCVCVFIRVEMTSCGQGNHGVITAHNTLWWSNPSMISSNKCCFEPIMSIIYTYLQTTIFVQIYHCTSTYIQIICTLIIYHVSNNFCLYKIHIIYHVTSLYTPRFYLPSLLPYLPGTSKIQKRIVVSRLLLTFSKHVHPELRELWKEMMVSFRGSTLDVDFKKTGSWCGDQWQKKVV